MKARLVPVYFKSSKDDEFNRQVDKLKSLLAGQAEILNSMALGAQLPEADAAVFPQLLGDAYRHVREIREIKKTKLPLLIITSEFGTVSMWDWEIASFLRSEGIETIAPYSLEQTRKICRILAVKREMRNIKFLVYQDNPGKGFQPGIFKRFYWWEDRCTKLLKEKFGVSIVKKSFKKLGKEAMLISDREARKVLNKKSIKVRGLSGGALESAIKIYIALKREIEKEGNVGGAGINCLNESHFSDTTPCLAWSMLFEELGIVWACEADTMALTTEYLLNKSLGVPIMMTNVYPFLLGMTALKHERIPNFPKVKDSENHLLLAHCGYFGLVPESVSAEWTVKPKVLAIVNDNAHAIDARMPAGKVTLTKLDSALRKIMTVEGNLKGYVQYPGSDCRSAAIVKVADGHALINKLYSHHQCLMTGQRDKDIELMAKVFDLEIERM